MGLLDYWDANHDGHYSGAEIDRFQLDHAEYPGMFERANDDYGWNDGDNNSYDSYSHDDSSASKKSARDDEAYYKWLYGDDDDDNDDEDDWDDDEDDWGDDDDDQPATMDVTIVGTKYDDSADIWLAAKSDPDCVIELSREHDNDYDENAIAVYVDGEHAGYVPRNVAKKLAPLMDDGAELAVIGRKIKGYENADGEDCVNVTLTVEVHRA